MLVFFVVISLVSLLPANGLQNFGYQDLSVQTGSVIEIQAYPDDSNGEITHANGESASLVPTFSDFIPGDESFTTPMPITQSGSDLWMLLYVSTCAWVLVAGGLVTLVILSRKRTFARWLLPLSIGAVVLCSISTCILGFMAFGDSPDSFGEALPLPEPYIAVPKAPTSIPPTVAIPQTAPPEQGEEVELTLINNLSEEVCYI